MNFLEINSLSGGDWITFIFLLVFVLLAIAKLLYKERLFELATLFFSNTYIVKYSKDVNLIFNGFNVLLFSAQLLLLSLLILGFVFNYYPELLLENSILLYIKINLFLGLYFLLRFVLGFVLSALFDIKNQQQLVAFSKMSYLISVSLVLLPLLLVVFFTKKHNLLVFQVTISLFVIMLIIRYLLVFRINKNVFQNKWSNFFLYLCALEIAPLLLILKTIM